MPSATARVSTPRMFAGDRYCVSPDQRTAATATARVCRAWRAGAGIRRVRRSCCRVHGVARGHGHDPGLGRAARRLADDPAPRIAGMRSNTPITSGRSDDTNITALPLAAMSRMIA